MSSTLQQTAASTSTPQTPLLFDPAITTTPSETLEMKDLPEAPAAQLETSESPSETIQRAQIQRSETAEVFLGPDGAAPSTSAVDSAESLLRITLMLTTGSRHPYTISNRYLTSRKVTALDGDGKFDPREMSAYKLKELIWTDWRPEWEPRPRDPAAIRLIIMGRMLEDKSQLKDAPFSLENTNVVHMTVKPADLLDDEAEGAGKQTAKSGRRRSHDEGQQAGCCRCVVQ